jgi:hypothetical protein
MRQPLLFAFAVLLILFTPSSFAQEPGELPDGLSLERGADGNLGQLLLRPPENPGTAQAPNTSIVCDESTANSRVFAFLDFFIRKECVKCQAWVSRINCAGPGSPLCVTTWEPYGEPFNKCDNAITWQTQEAVR